MITEFYLKHVKKSLQIHDKVTDFMNCWGASANTLNILQ